MGEIYMDRDNYYHLILVENRGGFLSGYSRHKEEYREERDERQWNVHLQLTPHPIHPIGILFIQFYTNCILQVVPSWQTSPSIAYRQPYYLNPPNPSIIPYHQKVTQPHSSHTSTRVRVTYPSVLISTIWYGENLRPNQRDTASPEPITNNHGPRVSSYPPKPDN
jgi:hypothetical protein